MAHPALSELRQTRHMLGRLLAQLELSDVDGDSASRLRCRPVVGARRVIGGVSVVARRKPERPPPVEVSPGELPPGELRCGALIEVWAPDDGSHCTASRGYRHARRRWSEGRRV